METIITHTWNQFESEFVLIRNANQLINCKIKLNKQIKDQFSVPFCAVKDEIFEFL